MSPRVTGVPRSHSSRALAMPAPRSVGIRAGAWSPSDPRSSAEQLWWTRVQPVCCRAWSTTTGGVRRISSISHPPSAPHPLLAPWHFPALPRSHSRHGSRILDRRRRPRRGLRCRGRATPSPGATSSTRRRGRCCARSTRPASVSAWWATWSMPARRRRSTSRAARRASSAMNSGGRSPPLVPPLAQRRSTRVTPSARRPTTTSISTAPSGSASRGCALRSSPTTCSGAVPTPPTGPCRAGAAGSPTAGRARIAHGRPSPRVCGAPARDWTRPVLATAGPSVSRHRVAGCSSWWGPSPASPPRARTRARFRALAKARSR